MYLNPGCIPARYAGFTLLEVLISVFILSVGLLGHASLQTLGIRENTNSYLRGQATVLVNDFVERVRSNAPAGQAGTYDLTYSAINCSALPVKRCTDTTVVNASICTVGEMVTEDAFSWTCESQTLLPNSTMTAAWEADVVNAYTVRLTWSEIDAEGVETAKNVSLVFQP